LEVILQWVSELRRRRYSGGGRRGRLHCAVRSSAITTTMIVVVLGCSRHNGVGRVIATVTHVQTQNTEDGFQRKPPTAKPQPEAQASGGQGDARGTRHGDSGTRMMHAGLPHGGGAVPCASVPPPLADGLPSRREADTSESPCRAMAHAPSAAPAAGAIPPTHLANSHAVTLDGLVSGSPLATHRPYTAPRL
jgi:hypothetical protein